jgi:hypothetical protein
VVQDAEQTREEEVLSGLSAVLRETQRFFQCRRMKESTNPGRHGQRDFQ